MSTDSSEAHNPTPAEAEPDQGTAATNPSPVSAEPEPVVALGGPEEFARAVAEALFTWDTTSGYGPADYAQTPR